MPTGTGISNLSFFSGVGEGAAERIELHAERRIKKEAILQYGIANGLKLFDEAGEFFKRNLIWAVRESECGVFVSF
jgi:hypothetical protein